MLTQQMWQEDAASLFQTSFGLCDHRGSRIVCASRQFLRGFGETRYLSERTEVLEGPLQVSSNHEVFSSREVQNLVD